MDEGKRVREVELRGGGGVWGGGSQFQSIMRKNKQKYHQIKCLLISVFISFLEYFVHFSNSSFRSTQMT